MMSVEKAAGLLDNLVGMVDDNQGNDYDTALKMAIEALQTEPKIIRCCQCKYAEVADSEDSQDGYTCQFHRGSIWFSGSYCSWAERRQDG